jgi:hypothetical protein
MTDRELLWLWIDWWNGPGRRGYHGVVLPPLTATREQVKCLVCSGIDLGGDYCRACERGFVTGKHALTPAEEGNLHNHSEDSK